MVASRGQTSRSGSQGSSASRPMSSDTSDLGWRNRTPAQTPSPPPSEAEPVRQPLGQPPLDATRGNDHDLLGKGVAEGRREEVAERLRQQVGARCPVQVKRHGATLGGAADSGSAPSPG